MGSIVGLTTGLTMRSIKFNVKKLINLTMRLITL